HADRIGWRHHVDAPLLGDCREILRMLLLLIARKEDASFLEKSNKRMAQWNESLRKQGTRGDPPLKPQVVAYQLNQWIDDDAIVCVDTGSVTVWAARFIDMKHRREFSV